jgi:hypothetical protein
MASETARVPSELAVAERALSMVVNEIQALLAASPAPSHAEAELLEEWPTDTVAALQAAQEGEESK